MKPQNAVSANMTDGTTTTTLGTTPSVTETRAVPSQGLPPPHYPRPR